ncbi:LuxR C-terminal-related transcriptional regulator [Aestuariivita sp.]|jgi:PAS domain S-box-containing protein|uniref:LuxR C-terminal-related transcriptional regulator n=1 Tax=Aestuariivita sp. TaxID=1872407 RepID=UPI00216C56CA|nr:LuxR C-terminal-related transcriptional regulator [Aestuariivita sp.]MCE8007877.1 PAS domain-containing protein [Aestuariivita sp.]
MSDPGFEHAPLGLAELENRIIMRCNARFAAIFGATAQSFAHQPIAELYPSHEEYERVGARGLAMMQDSGRYTDERIMRRRDGGLFWCRVRGQSLTPDDPLRHGIWSFSDISEDRPVVQLTARERDVALLTARGLSAKEIGRALNLSHRTIEAHRARLLDKFGARKLAELVAKLSGMPI